MRFAGITGLILLAGILLLGCGAGSYSGSVNKSGAAGPQDLSRGDAPPPDEGPAAIEVRYTEQVDGEISRDILLKADSTLIIIVQGYASKDAKKKTKERWDTKLKDVQTQAIMEGCSYTIMTALKSGISRPAPGWNIATIAVKFANGEEITLQTSNQAPPPNDFRAIAYTLTELAREKVSDKRNKPVEVPA